MPGEVIICRYKSIRVLYKRNPAHICAGRLIAINVSFNKVLLGEFNALSVSPAILVLFLFLIRFEFYVEFRG